MDFLEFDKNYEHPKAEFIAKKVTDNGSYKCFTKIENYNMNTSYPFFIVIISNMYRLFNYKLREVN